MALTFPSNPTLNQVYSTGSLSWTWNGKSWNNGTSILATSNLVSSSVQFTNGNTTAFDTTSNITVGQITASFAKISGSIFGTASFATNAFSASYAPNIYVLPSNVVSSSAQHANGGGVAFDTNTNITVGQITASFAKITNLTVEYVTSSVMIITGSNKFGDASNDTQEFTGSVSMSGSLSVTGALNTSGTITSTATGDIFSSTAATTTEKFSRLNNTGGATKWGTESSVGGTIFLGTTAYASVFGSALNNPVQIASNNSVVATVSSTGLAVTGNVLVSNNLGFNGGVNDAIAYSASALKFYVGGPERVAISSTGLAVTGALSTTGAITLTGTSSVLNFTDSGSGTSRNWRIATSEAAEGDFLIQVSSAANLTPSISALGFDRNGAATFASNVAVTGALDVTSTIGLIRINSSADLDTTGYGYISYRDNSTGSYTERAYVGFGAGNGNFNLYSAAPGKVMTLGVNGVTSVLTISSTGLAVSGALTATGNGTFGGGGVSGTLLASNAGVDTTAYNAGSYNANHRLWLGTGNATNAFAAIRFSGSGGVHEGLFGTVQNASGNAEFFWNLYSGSSYAERLRLSSTGLAVTGDVTASGVFYANSETVGNSNSKFGASFPNANCGLSLRSSDNGSGVTFAAFRKADATVIGSISRVTTTDAVAYNTTSDGRLKENLRDFTDSGRLIDALKPRVFDWKNSDENGKNVIGFIAQEEHAADPIFAHIGAVSVGDEDPDTITKQWQRSDSALIPILVAELKALRQRVAALEAK